jgi:ElaB/YqjD/DUF883 family membrane-anchored ribosome-binding protein
MTYGSGVVAVTRHNETRWLADGSSLQVVLEGEALSQDVWITGTARAGELRALLPVPLSDPDNMVTAVLARAQQHPESGEIALLAVKFSDETASPIVIESPTPTIEPTVTVQHQPTSRGGRPVSERVTYLLDPHRVQQEIAAAQADDQGESQGRRQSGRQTGRGLIQLPKRIKLLMGVVFLIAIVLLAGGGWWWNNRQVQAEYQTVIAPLQTLLVQVQSQSTTQKNEARQSAQSLLDRVKNTKIRFHANKVALASLQEKTAQLATDLSGQKAVINLPVFYDFRLVAANFLARSATRIQDTAVFLDSAGDRIISLHLTDKTNQTLSADGITGAKDIAGLTTAAVVVDGKVVKRIPLSGAKPEITATLKDLQEATLIDSFGDNLYVYDRAAQQLWRVPTTQGATASAWVRSAKGVKLDTITSLAINGSVWMGANDGMIYRFVRGERQNFAPQSLLEPFSSNLLLTVNPEGEKLVVVEPAKQRMVIMDKEGVYQQQVNSAQIGGVTDVFLSTDEKSVYLVAGSVVYRVEI